MNVVGMAWLSASESMELLAVATAWFVGRPMLERSSQPQRTCEVIVLASGTMKCVHHPAHASRAAHAKPTSRAKH